MKVAITDGKGNVWLEKVPEPEPGDYQCLCRMLACASCTGTDLKHIHDKLPWQQNYPGMLGHESIGEVIAVGDKVRNFSIGDWILRPTPACPGETYAGYSSMWGGFSEYGLALDTGALLADNPEATPNPYTKYQLPVPRDLGISPGEATMLVTLKETAGYVASVGMRLNAAVLVLGAGSVGISMMRFAKLFGACPLIAVARRDEQLAYARDPIGADFVINSTRDDVTAQVRALTNGRGADILIDTTGSAEFIRDCLPALAPDGKAAAYATYRRDDPIANYIPEDKLVVGRTGEDTTHQYLLDAVRLGFVRLADFYSHTLPFAKISEGFAMLEAKEAFKIVFEMGE
jgi:threonine dehydrogenase-like Zn-dependent dehydrogenase